MEESIVLTRYNALKRKFEDLIVGTPYRNSLRTSTARALRKMETKHEELRTEKIEERRTGPFQAAYAATLRKNRA